MIQINPDNFSGDCYAFHGRNVIVHADDTPLTFNDLSILKDSNDSGDIILESGMGVCALLLTGKEVILPQNTKAVGLRFYNYGKDEAVVYKTFRAKGLVSWLDGTRYCSSCGTPLNPSAELTSMTCPGCGKEVFPRIDPCIIVLVSRDDKVLLARHAQRNQDIYACIAGFMEAGETAEQCVAREIMEETGITVKNIRYFGSQSWPFPQQLMLGFTAEYESGELSLQEEEIADAAWFPVNDCPATPPPGSIAFQLIENAKSKLPHVGN